MTQGDRASPGCHTALWGLSEQENNYWKWLIKFLLAGIGLWDQVISHKTP